METTKLTVTREVNAPLLAEEWMTINALLLAISFPGMEETSRFRWNPIAVRRVISRSRNRDGTVTEDFAEPGEFRVETDAPLSRPDVDALDAAVVVHDVSGRTADQVVDDQFVADITRLRQIHDAGIPNQDRDEARLLTVKLLLRELE